MSRFFTLLTALLFLSPTFAGGSQVALQGIKYQAMGHAGAALAFDASSMFFNPGAFVFTGRRLDLTLGINAVEGLTKFRALNSNYTAQTENEIATPFNAYLGGNINERIAIGVAVYNPFGSGIKWQDGWKGRYLIQEIALRSFYIQPTISIKINEWLGIGAGYVFAFGDVYLEKDIPVNSQNGERAYAALEGSTKAESYNLGVYVKPTEWMNIGISYRADCTFNLEDGKAKFYTSAFLQENFPPENQFDGTLPLPATAAFSVSFTPNEDWTIALEYDRTFWSIYDSLKIDFKTNTETLEDIADPKLYEDAYQFRLGLQYTPTDWLALRGGYVFDKTPIQSDFYGPETPDMDRSAYTTGATLKIGKHVDLDLAYTYVRGREYEATYSPANFGGNYLTTVNVFSAGFSFNF